MLGGGNQNSIPSQDNKQSFDDSSMAQNELDDDITFLNKCKKRSS